VYRPKRIFALDPSVNEIAHSQMRHITTANLSMPFGEDPAKLQRGSFDSKRALPFVRNLLRTLSIGRFCRTFKASAASIGETRNPELRIRTLRQTGHVGTTVGTYTAIQARLLLFAKCRFPL